MSGGAAVSAAAESVAYNLRDASSWWKEIDDSPLWQGRIFHGLAALYAVVAVVALVQLVRIQMRVPEYGWTTQKVFHFLNFVVNGVRSLVFVFRRNVQQFHPEIIQHIMLDVPSLAFFTTYALLVLFWAEIYYQARAVSTDGLRPGFFTINAVVYTIQIAMWIISWWTPVRLVIIISKMFFACVSLFSALGFLLYGGRLFLMLQRFPVESKGRRKKLQELRVDFAENDKGTDRTREQGRGGPGLAANIAPIKQIGGPMSGEAVLHQPIGLHAAITGATVMAGALGGAQASLTANQNGLRNQPALVSDPLTLHLANMSRSQLNEIMSELKMMGAQNKELARKLLLGRPQLAKALFQAQIMLGMVTPQVLQMPNIRQTPAHTSQPIFQDGDQNQQAALPGLPHIAQTRMQSGVFPQVHQGQASVASQIALGHNQFSVSPQLPVQPRVHLSQHSTNQVLEQATLPEQYGAPKASVQAYSTASLAPRPQIQMTMSSSLNQQMQPSLAQQRTTPIGAANLGQATRMPFSNANMQPSLPISSSIPETIYQAADKSTRVTDDARANLLLRNNTHSKRPMTVAGKTNLGHSSSELIGRPSKLPKLNDGRSTTFLANGNRQPQVSGPTNPDSRAEDMQYRKNQSSQPQLPSDMESALLQQVMNLTAEQLNLLPPEQQQQVIQLQQMLRRDQVQPS